MGTQPEHVMFLHALGAWPAAWEQQIRALPQGFEGFAPTIPGVADAGEIGSFDLREAAAAMVAELDRRGIERVHLCGLSLGAMVATWVALDHPGRVASLVLSGSQIAPNPALMAIQRTVIRLLPERAATTYGLTKAGWLVVLRAIADTDVRARLHEIDVPTLVLCGTRDIANLPAARQLARSVRGARLEIVKGAGHEWNLQLPERFDATIGAFYRELGAPAARS